MQDIFNYLVKLSVSLGVVYLFYRFLLRPLTFYTWNRWFLLAYSAISFIIPFVDINPLLPGEIANNQVVHMIPLIDPRLFSEAGWLNLSDYRTWLLLFVVTGVIVMLVRLGLQFWSYKRLKNQSTLIASQPVKLYQVDKDIVPFSFGNAIFINKHQHSEAELQEIIKHEFIHVRQKHSLDMIWAELLCIINWYNPAAWLIKKVICQNLEFIADQQVLQNGVDKKEYQYLLLKVAGGASYRIANQFNLSFLKKRIMMMNKIRSAKIHLLRFAFVLPLLAILLLSFRAPIAQLMEDSSEKVTVITATGSSSVYEVAVSANPVDTVPGQQKEIELPEIEKVMYIVDEIVRDRRYVEQLDGADIASVDVLKGESTLQYGDRGKNGVIRIYTKATKTAGKNATVKLRGAARLTLNTDSSQPARTGDVVVVQADTIRLSKPATDTGRYVFRGREGLRTTSASVTFRPATTEPLFFVDGVKLSSQAQLSELEPDIIESINVVKDENATKMYGSSAAGGVVHITTKKQKSPVLKLQLKQDTVARERPMD